MSTQRVMRVTMMAGAYVKLCLTFSPALNASEQSTLETMPHRLAPIYGDILMYDRVKRGRRYFFVAINNIALDFAALREVSAIIAQAFDAQVEVLDEKLITDERLAQILQREKRRRPGG